MKAKLNLQAIRVAEKLLKKPFGEFNLSDDETLVTLMYTMVCENSEESFDLDQFKSILKSKKLGNQIRHLISNEMRYASQFREDGESSGEQPYMGDIAAILIGFGLDARFVLYEMKLFEIADYLKVIDDHKKEQMERDRLWTFYTILPHVDQKKLKSPHDLMPFPWEDEKIKEDRLKQIEKDEEMFNKFFNSKPL